MSKREFSLLSCRSLVAAVAVCVSFAAAAAPAVPVTVTNTPSVSIANVPTVLLGNAVSVGNTVSVTSSSAQPVVVDEGYSARHAQGARCNATFDASGTATCTLVNVSSGQIFVIEAISCRASLPSPSGYAIFPALLLVPEPQVGGGTYSLDHTLALQKAYSNGSNDYFAGTFPLRIAVPGPALSGSSYPVSIQAQGGGAASAVLGITCTATGYLVTN